VIGLFGDARQPGSRRKERPGRSGQRWRSVDHDSGRPKRRLGERLSDQRDTRQASGFVDLRGHGQVTRLDERARSPAELDGAPQPGVVADRTTTPASSLLWLRSRRASFG
jgi:hypothetical protein